MAKASKASSDVVGAIVGEFWGDRRYAYDAAGNIEYIWRAETPGASTTSGAAVGELFKVTYTNGRVTRIEGPLANGFDERATAPWS